MLTFIFSSLPSRKLVIFPYYLFFFFFFFWLFFFYFFFISRSKTFSPIKKIFFGARKFILLLLLLLLFLFLFFCFLQRTSFRKPRIYKFASNFPRNSYFLLHRAWILKFAVCLPLKIQDFKLETFEFIMSFIKWYRTKGASN